MLPLPSFGISGWSWLNALGAHAYRVGDPLPPYLLEESGLSRQSLDLPGTWGRVISPLAPLPTDLARHHSRCAQLLLTALEPLRDCVEDARARYGAERVAVVLGSSTGGIDATEHALAEERRTGRMPEDFIFEEAHVYHALIRLLREVLHLDGVGFVISTACSSSGKALGAAQRLLACGQADAVLTGGVDALCEMTLRGFAGLGILAPEGCRPFDRTRNGISIGEGAALLLLERSTESPYRLLGVGESSDAYHATAPHPEGLGARLAMERALCIAGLSADQIDYVNAHGTGTAQNDSAEAKAIFRVLGASVRFSSTKDRTGHLLGTAGATEALFCLHAMQTRVLPPNLRPAELDTELLIQPFVERLQSDCRNAQSNSFAFGGSNVSVVLSHDPATLPGATQDTVPSTLLPEGRLFVTRTSLWGAGFPDAASWLEARPDASVEKPRAELLGARSRGRASVLTRLFAELYAQLRGPTPPFDETQISLVFGSAYGEVDTTLVLLDQLGIDKTLSPARFQNSVHNTSAGIISMTTQNRGFSTALAAGPNTFAMSVLEATTWLRLHGGDALVLVGDETGPERMLRGRSFPALGVGLHLTFSSRPPPGALAELRMPELAPWSDEPHVPMPQRAAPAAWGLPLLERLARGQYGTTRLGPRWQSELLPLR